MPARWEFLQTEAPLITADLCPAGYGGVPASLRCPPASSSSLSFAETSEGRMSHETHGLWRRARCQRCPAQPLSPFRRDLHRPSHHQPRPLRPDRSPRQWRPLEPGNDRPDPAPRPGHRSRCCRRVGDRGRPDQPNHLGAIRLPRVAIASPVPRRSDNRHTDAVRIFFTIIHDHQGRSFGAPGLTAQAGATRTDASNREEMSGHGDPP